MAPDDHRKTEESREPERVEQARSATSGIADDPRMVIELSGIPADGVFRFMSPRLEDRHRATDFVMEVTLER